MIGLIRRIDVAVKSLKHNPRGQFVVVCGDGEYVIYTPVAWRNRSCGSALEIVWSPDEEYAAWKSTSRSKIFSKSFQEKKSIWPTFSAERINGGTFLAMFSSDFFVFMIGLNSETLRSFPDFSIENCVLFKIVYLADGGDLVAIASEYLIVHAKVHFSAHLDSGRSRTADGVEDPFELLYEINELVRTGICVGECFIYILL